MVTQCLNTRDSFVVELHNLIFQNFNLIYEAVVAYYSINW